MKVALTSDGREVAMYDDADKLTCLICGAKSVVPLTPQQLAAQPDETTLVCHPALGGCNQGFTK